MHSSHSPSKANHSTHSTIVTKAAPVKKTIKKIVKKVAPAAFTAPDFSVTENIFSDLSDKDFGTNIIPKARARNKFYNRTVLGFIALALVTIFLLVAVILPKGEIIVYARTEPVARDIEINVSAKTEKPDLDKLALPATFIERTVEMRDKFTPNGKRDVGTKAEGSVAIYNLTGKPLNLKASTTTLTVGSKSYYFKLDQNSIRPAGESGSGQAPSVAEIIAGEGGEDFNLPAGTRIEISNQVFGSHPQQLYAKTQTQIIGGTSRFVSFISQNDIDDAQKALADRIVKQLTEELAGKNLIMPEGAYNKESLAANTDKQAGTESPTFEAYQNLKVSGLAFNKETLSTLIRDRISRNLGDTKKLQEANLDTLEFKIKSYDIASQSMTVMVHFESQTVAKLEAGDVKNQISGKSKQEASEILLSKPEVSRVDITLSPVWQRSIPRFTQKINLEIK
jgi:hypothetical protein